MPKIGCQTCEIIRRIAADYSDPSLICPECRGKRSAPAGPWQALDHPGIAGHKMKDDDDEPVGKNRPKLGKKKKDKAGGSGKMIVMILGGVGLLFACCICTPIGVGVALFMPAIQKVRETAARTQSTNNLKNLGLGFHAFHDVNKRLPFNGSDTPNQQAKYSAKAIGGNPQSGSWGFQVLPYVDHAPAFNAALRNEQTPTFYCPGRMRPKLETSNGGGAWSDYFINGYVNDAKQASKPDAMDNKRNMVAINDGTSNTIFLGHGNINVADYSKSGGVTGSSNIFVGGTIGTMRSGNNGETNPGGVTLSKDSDKAPGIGSWGGPFAQGALMGMGDATVRIFTYTTRDFSVFLTPSGNDVGILPD